VKGFFDSSPIIVDSVFLFIVGVSFAFLALVTVLMVYFVVRYRKGRHPVAEEVRENFWLEFAWTAIPTALMIAMFVFGFWGFRWMRRAPADSVPVTVQAQMWKYAFVYQNGRRTDDLVVQQGMPVKLLLHSADVIHGFFIPAYRVKEDAVPGRENHLWFLPDTEGTFDIMCTVYCGEQHAFMRTKLRVLPDAEFRKWNGAQVRSPESIGGRGLMQSMGCLVCHSLDGRPGPGPTLKGIWGRKQTVETAGQERLITVDREYIERSIMEPGADIVKGFRPIMPAVRMTPRELEVIRDYLKGVR